MLMNAIWMTVAAGLSTGLGGLVVFFCRRPTTRLLAGSMGFAAGVMLTVSLVDMLPATMESYRTFMPAAQAVWATLSLFCCGCVIARLLSDCLPRPSAQFAQDRFTLQAAQSALVTMAVIVLHNLPEGILTLFTGYQNPRLGVVLTAAIALHNIPEGIAVSMPVFYATKSRVRGFWAALGSGLAEPCGALLCFFVLRRFISNAFLDGLVALIAGLMCFVCYSELIPGSLQYKQNKAAVLGMAVGTVVMGAGIWLLGA